MCPERLCFRELGALVNVSIDPEEFISRFIEYLKIQLSDELDALIEPKQTITYIYRRLIQSCTIQDHLNSKPYEYTGWHAHILTWFRWTMPVRRHAARIRAACSVFARFKNVRQ